MFYFFIVSFSLSSLYCFWQSLPRPPELNSLNRVLCWKIPIWMQVNWMEQKMTDTSELVPLLSLFAFPLSSSFGFWERKRFGPSVASFCVLGLLLPLATAVITASYSWLFDFFVLFY